MTARSTRNARLEKRVLELAERRVNRRCRRGVAHHCRQHGDVVLVELRLCQRLEDRPQLRRARDDALGEPMGDHDVGQSHVRAPRRRRASMSCASHRLHRLAPSTGDPRQVEVLLGGGALQPPKLVRERRRDDPVRTSARSAACQAPQPRPRGARRRDA